MIDLNELLDQPVPVREVTVRGKVVAVRPLTSAEDDLIAAAFPEPRIPMISAGAGSNAAPQPDRNDPEYVRRRAEVMGKRLAGQVAIAIDAQIDGVGLPGPGSGGDAKARVDWLKKAAVMICDKLSDREMGRITEATAPAPMKLEEAGKNS